MDTHQSTHYRPTHDANDLIYHRQASQAIHFAAYYGLESFFEENIASLHQMSLLDCSPLFYACLGGYMTLVKRVLDDFGASPGIGYATKFGATVLHAACGSGQVIVVRLVLNLFDQQGTFSTVQRHSDDLSAEVNAKMWNGQTALHLASEHGYEEVVSALLGHIER
jgi:ankyrin repeat protein